MSEKFTVGELVRSRNQATLLAVFRNGRLMLKCPHKGIVVSKQEFL